MGIQWRILLCLQFVCLCFDHAYGCHYYNIYENSSFYEIKSELSINSLNQLKNINTYPAVSIFYMYLVLYTENSEIGRRLLDSMYDFKYSNEQEA